MDGSGWEAVYYNLAKENPTTSLKDDAEVTRRAIAASPGKVVLVGRSYGGVIITRGWK
ncbi:hypothetical protein HFO27_33945 [Rhizobium leguminosarum]|uniref:hypothetical protein n=1 Tax=Rhizobium leguminosarum TaxID=384 RepID=UPI001C90A946|nr:hypothetical protein [Rhizobium leguminosarum]MBY3179517.1 hypothetical protein [Rhizobium leguminosarum]MBY5646661.1 hypothetical protein [Rhizobium leguminosarum]